MNDDIETWLNETLKLMARKPEYWSPRLPEESRSYLELLSDFVRAHPSRGQPYTIPVRKES